MKVKALAPWFGSKRILAPKIIEEFGDHRAYWGLCSGSMAIELVKPRCSMETVIDLNDDITNLALVIQNDELCDQLYDQLCRTWMSDKLFARSAKVIRCENFELGDYPDLLRAYHYFVFCWMGRNGDAGTTKVGYSFCKRYTKNGGHAATRFRGVVDSLDAFNDRLRNFTILRGDIFEFLPRIEDADGVVIYVDPPYLKKGAKYVHDFESGDHEWLSNELGRFEHTRVVVSYYEDERLAQLYPADRWTKRSLRATKSMVNSGSRDKTGIAVVAPEVLLINGPSYAEPEGLF